MQRTRTALRGEDVQRRPAAVTTIVTALLILVPQVHRAGTLSKPHGQGTAGLASGAVTWVLVLSFPSDPRFL